MCDIWNSGATTDDQFLFALYWLSALVFCQFCAAWNLFRRLSKWLRIHARPLIDFVLQVHTRFSSFAFSKITLDYVTSMCDR